MLFKWLGIIGIGSAVFGMSYYYNKKFLDWLRFQSLGTRDYIVEKLSYMFVEVPPHQILFGQFAISFGFGLVVFLLILPMVVPAALFGLMFTIIGWKAPKPIVNLLYKRRVNKFLVQMVDGLGLMANGLRSGLSIVQSLGLVVQELPNPIRQEFDLVLSQNKLGVPLEEAFTNLSKRIEADDVEMFVTAINILKETGGNLAETFDTIVGTMRERLRVEKKIEAMTIQGKLQGYIVMAVPVVMGTVFYISDPEFMAPLFTTTIGWMIILVIFLLEIVGFFVIMKIVKIEV